MKLGLFTMESFPFNGKWIESHKPTICHRHRWHCAKCFTLGKVKTKTQLCAHRIRLARLLFTPFAPIWIDANQWVCNTCNLYLNLMPSFRISHIEWKQYSYRSFFFSCSHSSNISNFVGVYYSKICSLEKWSVWCFRYHMCINSFICVHVYFVRHWKFNFHLF